MRLLPFVALCLLAIAAQAYDDRHANDYNWRAAYDHDSYDVSLLSAGVSRGLRTHRMYLLTPTTPAAASFFDYDTTTCQQDGYGESSLVYLLIPSQLAVANLTQQDARTAPLKGCDTVNGCYCLQVTTPTGCLRLLTTPQDQLASMVVSITSILIIARTMVGIQVSR